jgi:hypothetical protein
MNHVDRRRFLKTTAGLAASGGLMNPGHLMAATDSRTTDTIAEAGQGAWSLVILPDTQVYARAYPGLFHLQTQWVLENKGKHNIVYVLQNGDVTDNNVDLQWQRASQAFARLDGKIPYAIALGNHDFGPNGGTQDRTTLGNRYFPLSRFAAWPTFGGPMEVGKIDNTFHLFRAGGQDYLILCLEFGPRDEVLAWANRIIEKHPRHKVIVMTHAYLYSDSTRYDWKSKGDEQKWNPHAYPIAATDTTINDGQDMWDKLVKRHPNILMTINGHVLNDGLGFLTSKGDAGNTVHQMLVNYQMLAVGGGAWLRLLTFDPDGTITVQDYSPLYETFNTEPDNQFVMPAG